MEPQLNEEVARTAAGHDGPIETDAVIVGAGGSATAVWVSVPIPSMAATIRSPGFRNVCSGRTDRDIPVPAGLPPATSTLPLGSKTARCPLRLVAIGGTVVHNPVAGSYSSAVDVTEGKRPPVKMPPATNTLPFGSNVLE